jgi:diguanylate cyclase (GGDEF)-like protein
MDEASSPDRLVGALRAMLDATSSRIAFWDRDLRLVAATAARRAELAAALAAGGKTEGAAPEGLALASLLASDLYRLESPRFVACLEGQAQGFSAATSEEEVSLVPARLATGEVFGLVETRRARGALGEHERLLKERERELETAFLEMKRLATTDSLAGSLNRGAILATLEEEIRRAARYDRPLALILFDLDRFKLVNDIHGRTTGDAVIRRFSSICASSFRNTDFFGRYGGEEFLAVLPEVPATGAVVAAERVRLALQNERFRAAELQGAVGHGGALAGTADPGSEFTVTVSAGVAGWEKGLDSDNFLASVDAALYRAKEKGRNRVEAGGRH